MTKRDFLQTLEKRLGILPKAERDETIAYYRELIEDMMEEGCSEQEAVSRLEDIDLIVGRILGEKGAAASAEPARHKGGSCLRAFLIGAVALIIIALILSYAGVAVVGKVFDGLRMQNTAEKGELQLEEVTASIEVSEDGVEIRDGDFKLSINEEEGIQMTGQLPEKWSDWQEGLDRLAEAQNTGDPAALTEAHILCELPPKGIHSLSVEWVSASVEICTHDQDTVLAVEYAAEPLSDEQVGIAQLEEGELEIDFDNERNHGRYPHKKLVVYLPEGLMLNELSVEAASADLTVTGINGHELETDTASGSVTVEGLWKDIDIDTASGNITLVPGPDFKLQFNTASGKLDSGSYDLKQNKNSYTAGSGTVRVVVNTASGDLTLK